MDGGGYFQTKIKQMNFKSVRFSLSNLVERIRYQYSIICISVYELVSVFAAEGLNGSL